MRSPKEGLVITGGEVLLVIEENNIENAQLSSAALFCLVVCQYLFRRINYLYSFLLHI